MSSLERARPLAHEGRFARPVRGKREWDENENEAESWQVERTALRRPSVREAIQASEEKNTVLARRHGVNRKTIAKWKAREFSSDMRMGPKNPRSKSLTLEDEMIILAYRWRTRLSLDDRKAGSALASYAPKAQPCRFASKSWRDIRSGAR